MDEAIEKAEQKIEYLSSDEETIKIYYERERLLHERANMVNSAEKRGKIEVARNLINMNMSLEDIVLAAALTIEEIK